MRVISGEKRGKRLISLEGDSVRPTTDRVKESLFSIIQFDLPGAKFLDLFAGSGQIAVEALSRGAGFAYLVDSSNKSIKVCAENVKACSYEEKTKLVSMKSDEFLKNTSEMFDVAFLDPPYHFGLLEENLMLLGEKMNKNGIIICEHPFSLPLPNVVGELSQYKSYKYGKIALTVYR